MISGGTEVNRFSYIHLILEMKFGDDSLLTLVFDKNLEANTCTIVQNSYNELKITICPKKIQFLKGWHRFRVNN